MSVVPSLGRRAGGTRGGARTVQARPMQRCVVRSSTQGGGADGQGFPPPGPGSGAMGGAMDEPRSSPRSPGAGVRDMNDMLSRGT